MPSASGRLLRRHLRDFPGFQIEHHARNLIEIRAGDTHEARSIGIVYRMNGSILVDLRMARLESIRNSLFELAVTRIGPVIEPVPLRDVGVAGGLTIDRPRCAVIVGWG